MKKKVLLSFLLVFALLFTACSSPGGRSEASSSSKAPSTSTPGSVNQEDIPTLRFGHGGNDAFAAHYGALAFQEVAANSPNGTVNIDIYPGAQLGAEREMVEAVMLGNLDIAVSMTFTVSSICNIPELLLYEMPWLITDRDLLYDVISNNETFKTITTDLMESKGIKYLGAADIGYYGVTASKPIRTPEDMVNMKFRTAENPLIVSWFGELGANPVVVAINEVFTALQQGVMDGVYTTITMMAQTKTYEIAKEITSLNNALGITFLVMNLETFNSLSPEQQATLEEAGRAYIQAQREASETETERVVAEMGDTGANFYSLSEAEMAPFREAVAPVYDVWRKQIGEEYFAETQAYIEAWNK